MSRRALVLTYHAVEDGPSPLCVAPTLFRAHLEVILESGALCLTVTALAEALAHGLDEPAVALTFDDGFASSVREAGALLPELGLTATVYCVGAFLGGTNDWPSQPARAPRLPLADAAALRDLAGLGVEIGSHSMTHTPLDRADGELVLREVVGSKEMLEQSLGLPVTSFAYPYGVLPSAAARSAVESAYSAACTARIAAARPGVDPFSLPRVDAHYLRRPSVLRAALRGEAGGYLLARRLAARARRALRKDYDGE